MEELKNAFNIIGVVALRKTALFEKIWYQFEQTLPENIEKNKARDILLKIIANLDNDLLISNLEKKNKIIDQKLSLEELNLNETEIWNKVEETLSELTE